VSRSTKIWDPNDWESYIKLLLRVHYGPGQFVEVPAKHGGDFGIEGFSRDGCAYQCYAAQEPLSTEDLYTKQRDKITTDLNKFVKNRVQLILLLTTTIISRWILIVPRFESASIVQHCGKKAQEIRAANLPYVAVDFQVAVDTDDLFAIERAMLLKNGLTQISLPLTQVPADQITQWAGSNPVQIQTLDSKLVKLAPTQSNVQQKDRRDQMVRHLLQGQNALQELHLHYPELYEAVRHCKDGRENFLATESQLLSQSPQKLLADVLAQFKGELTDSVSGLERYTAEQLVWEAVSDWLVRCPLNFPDGPNG
jgi:hypothetical protein